VVLAARRLERLQALAEEIQRDGGQALPIQADLSDLDSIQNMVQTSLDHWGQIDILLNNAGFGRLDWLENLDPTRGIEAQINVNVLGLIQTTRFALPHMIERRSGHIINMASMAGLVATPTYTIYAACKFAVRGFTDALRREVGVWGIHVSAIYPGGVETEFKAHTGAKRKTGVTTPKALILTSDDVARAVLNIVKRPRRMVLLPWVMWFSAWFNALFPGVVDRTVENRFVKPERGL